MRDGKYKARNPHNLWGRLVFEHYRQYRLIVSLQIVKEAVKVLQRPELVTRFSTLKGIDTTRVIDILQKVEVVMPRSEPDVSRDVKDNKFLAIFSI